MVYKAPPTKKDS